MKILGAQSQKMETSSATPSKGFTYLIQLDRF